MLIDDIEKFKRENTEGLINQYGTCRFCGQSKMFQTIQPWRQDALDEAAAESCGCYESQKYARIKRMKEKADEAIEKKVWRGCRGRSNSFCRSERIFEESCT